MKLNNYLRIKTADKSLQELYDDRLATYDPIFKETGGKDVVDLFSDDPDMQQTARVHRVDWLYRLLSAKNNMHVDVPVFPGVKNEAAVELDPVTGARDMSRRYITLDSTPSFVTLLHEKGHERNSIRNNHKNFMNGPMARHNAYKIESSINKNKPDNEKDYHYDYYVYNPEDLRGTLAEEQNATQYAREFVNTIKDKAVRDKLNKSIRDELDEAYKSYKVMYGRPLTADTIGRYATIGLGAGLGGYAGYRIGDWISNKAKLNKTWGNIARYGLAGLGGLGLGYLGHRYRKYGGQLGQLGIQYLDNKTGYKKRALDRIVKNVTDASARNMDADMDLIEDYYNRIK